MGFHNPSVPWSELERRLGDGRRTNVPEHANGGDSPAWSRKRQPVDTKVRWKEAAVRYAELHCHSNFSFLDGASSPEALAEEAARLGLTALALTDHDGFYGVVRFAEMAKVTELPVAYGAELSLGLTQPQNGIADPEGHHLLVLARNPEGYARLARTISEAQLRGAEKGKPVYDLDAMASAHGDHWLVLTGCRKGAVPAALIADGPAAASKVLADLVERFGAHNVVVELWDHGDPLDSYRNDAMAKLAVDHGLGIVATNNVHYATPDRRRLATALAAVRARRSLDEIDGWLPAAASAHLRSGAEQARRFQRYPGAVELAAELGRACAFPLELVAPELPPFDGDNRELARMLPFDGRGLDEMAILRRLVERGGTERYGPRGSSGISNDKAWAQLDRELALIEQLGYPGYFLVVWEITEFCRQHDIYCQGRGSAANSAVCFALKITNVDAVRHGLLFERFLSAARTHEPPDIDIDIESGRREEVIQHVYAVYGRERTAQVANVITYRAKSAIRDMAKAFGFAPGQQDAWSKQVDAWGSVSSTATLPDHDIPAQVLELAQEVEDFPRHLGIHSGGMVICDRPVVEVCPVEWARMEDRSVLQWDKDDCARIKLVKFDLLGLGMLSALHLAFDHVQAAHGETYDLHSVEHDDPAVYDMLCRADSVGVFQVESRAQMATLPRLQPRTFDDLVIEIALIRPGPIQGGSVHPYIRRRKEQEAVTYPHPLTEAALKKTLGVPLFQEQLMRIAIDVGGFSHDDADRLRQAMSAKRSEERMAELEQRFAEGARANGVDEPTIEQLWLKLRAFANYGFPESHSVSFAYLVYVSAWLKRWYPAAFCAGLLAAQPMGFYSPHSLVQDARRHGVEVRTPDLNRSGAQPVLEPPAPNTVSPYGFEVAARAGLGLRAGPGAPPEQWGRFGPAVRLGLASVRSIGDDLAEAIVDERVSQPFASMLDLWERVPDLTLRNLEALAVAGAFDGFGLDRRKALWQAGAIAQGGRDRIPGIVTGIDAPTLPGMSLQDLAIDDLVATGIAPEGHPTRFVRQALAARGVITAAELREVPDGERVWVAGVVTHRQRPATAQGITFMNLEDETGFVNVVVSKGCWARWRGAARGAAALVVHGKVESAEGVVNVLAQRIDPLRLPSSIKSRDFR